MKFQYHTKFFAILFLVTPFFVSEARDRKQAAPATPPPRYSEVFPSAEKIIEEEGILPQAVTFNQATCFAKFTVNTLQEPGTTWGKIAALDHDGYPGEIAHDGIFPNYRFGEIWARRLCYILKQRGICATCTATLAEYNKYYYGK